MTTQLKARTFAHAVLEIADLFGLDHWTAERLTHAHCHRLGMDPHYHLVTSRAVDFLAALGLSGF